MIENVGLDNDGRSVCYARTCTALEQQLYRIFTLHVAYQRWNRVRMFDPTRPDLVVERCETNPRQRLDSSIGHLSGNPNRLVA